MYLFLFYCLLFTCLFLVQINSIVSACESWGRGRGPWAGRGRGQWAGRGRGPWEIVLPLQLENILNTACI